MTVMILRRRVALMLILVMSGLAEVQADEQRPTLTQAVARLVEAQAHLQGAAAAAGLVLPSGLTDVLIVRRTIAADWQRRLDAKAVMADEAGLLRFTDEVQVLVGSLQQVANLAQQSGDAPRRYPHCLNEAAYTRYRTLVNEAFDQGLHAVITGRLRDRVAPAAWFQRQARHTMLLSLIEAGHRADEEYALLPPDDRWLIEYREHLLLTRATLERRLAQSDEGDPYQHQAVLEAYTRLLDLRVQQLQRVASCGLPDTAPEVMTYRRAGDLRVAVLVRLIGLARGNPGDDDEQWRREAQEHRLLMRTVRFTELADEWLSFESERRELAADFTGQLADGPVELAGLTRAVIDDGARAHQSAQTAFAQAVDAGDVVAALAAKHAVDRARQQSDRRLMYLEEDFALGERERAWRAHAKDPAIAEKLREWEMRRAGALSARRAADEAADAALVASQAAERAQLASEAAEEHAATVQDEAEQHDLSELIEALEEMVDLRAGNAPEQ